MNVWLLSYNLLEIVGGTIAAIGFGLLYFKHRRKLFLFLACMFTASLADCVVVLFGEVIPALSYVRLAGADNLLPIMLLKEALTLLCLFFARKSVAEAVGPKLGRWEMLLWGLAFFVVMLMKLTPYSQSRPVFLMDFCICNLAVGAVAFPGLRQLLRHSARYTPSFFQFWICIFVLTLCVYIVGGAIKVGAMLGLLDEAMQIRSNICWDGYLAAGLIYLIRALSCERAADMETDIYAVKRCYQLTERETEIFRLLLHGKSNNDISLELHIALGTVKTHTYNIYQKLGVNRRTQLQEILESVSEKRFLDKFPERAQCEAKQA